MPFKIVGSVVGGIINHGAAGKASNILANGAQSASDTVGVATGDANKPIQDATTAGQSLALGAGGRVVDASKVAAAGATGAATSANALLNPYTSAGSDATDTLHTGLAPGGDFNKTPTLQDLQIDPGYKFRLQQGEDALSRSAAARGDAVSGAALKDLVNYEQGSASQEYKNAFDRFETSTQNRFNNLSSVSGRGQQAAEVAGGNTIDAAKYGGTITTGAATTDLGANEFAGQEGLAGAEAIGSNTMTGARARAEYATEKAQAQAGGTIGQANAISGAVGGVANGFSSLFASPFGNLLKNPAAQFDPAASMASGSAGG